MNANLRAQGSSVDAFHEHVDEIRRETSFELKARHEGFLTVSLGSLREILTELQRNATTALNPFPDPAGIILGTEPGDYVASGEPIARVRCTPEAWDELSSRLWASAFRIVDNPGESVAFEEVSCA